LRRAVLTVAGTVLLAEAGAAILAVDAAKRRPRQMADVTGPAACDQAQMLLLLALAGP